MWVVTIRVPVCQGSRRPIWVPRDLAPPELVDRNAGGDRSVEGFYSSKHGYRYNDIALLGDERSHTGLSSYHYRHRLRDLALVEIHAVSDGQCDTPIAGKLQALKGAHRIRDTADGDQDSCARGDGFHSSRDWYTVVLRQHYSAHVRRASGPQQSAQVVGILQLIDNDDQPRSCRYDGVEIGVGERQCDRD